MPSAVITPLSGAVVDCIVADASRDYAPSPGQVLINIPDGISVSAGYTWTSSGGFQAPLAGNSTATSS